jgi:hypothetical protein
MRQIEISLDVHRAIENARRSFEETESDILWRLLDPSARSGTTLSGIDPAVCETPTSRNETAIPIGRRTTGQWLVRAEQERYVARNLREAYLTALSRIAEHDPGVLEKLAREGDGRRRIVARKPADLYPRSPHLADPRRNNWHQLGDWFVDLNLSRDQAAKRIRRACALAGLRYGADLTIMDNLSAL